MDEPQLTSPVDDSEASVDKTNLDEVLDSPFAADEIEKAVSGEEATVESEPGTSADALMSEEASEAVNVLEAPSAEPAIENAGQEPDLSTSDIVDDHHNQSVEEVIFQKPNSELDDSATPDAEQDNLDFTENSINISQLNVEHVDDDDSNDAFNALKNSEIDALQTPKEELEESKEPEESSDLPASDVAKDSDITEIVDNDKEKDEAADVPMETETSELTSDTPADALDDTAMSTEETADDNVEKDTEAADTGCFAAPQSVDKPDNDEVEEVPEDDGTTETTNEGEGIDEDVCLLGDETQCDTTNEADKETSSLTDSQAEEISEESATADKEAGEDEPSDEVIELDSDSGEKEVEESEAAEVEDEEEASEPAIPLKENEIRELSRESEEFSCLNCENTTKCLYELLEESGEVKHLCTFNCVKEHRDDNPDKYSLSQKRIQIKQIAPIEKLCSKCEETKLCAYRYNIKVKTTITKEPAAPAEGETVDPEAEPPQPTTEEVESNEVKYLCQDVCLKEFIGDNAEKYIVKQVVRRSERVREEPKKPEEEIPKVVARSDEEAAQAKADRDESLVRHCEQCRKVVNFTPKSVQWETFDFCNEKCLGSYQNLIGAACTHCNEVVSLASIGKLCVRFGPEIKQFCKTICLAEFKLKHLPCLLCSKNLKNDDGTMQPCVTKRGNNFCNDECFKRYGVIVSAKTKQTPHVCSVCMKKKFPKYEVLLDGFVHRFCSNPCYSAFKFVNNVNPDQCGMCSTHFERKSSDAYTIYKGNDRTMFCSGSCQNIYISKNREVWKCNWCKVSKYNFDMIQQSFGKVQMCSLNCLSLHEVSINALQRKRSKCDHCNQQKQPQYHLTMSDASIRNFCTYQCTLVFQSQFNKNKAAGDIPDVVPSGTAKRVKPASANAEQTVPKISLVQSLNPRRGARLPYNPTVRRTGSPIPVPELTVQLERLKDLPARVKVSSLSSLQGGSSNWTPISTSRGSSPVRVEHKTQVVTIPPLPKQVGNKSTMCKAITLNKAINCVPSTVDAECQTEDWLEQRVILPVPIVVYVPQPMMMYSMPTPVAVPFPLPIPVPIFVPTTRNSASGIMKEIKKIQEKMPTDPYEAELLMMAEMVAGDKKREETDSDSDENEIEYGDTIENNASFNEDLVQMAFKMAGNDFDDPPVDLENEMTANTISQSSNAYGDDMDPHSLQHHQLLLLQQQRDAAAAMQSQRGRKRIQSPVKPTNNRNAAPNKRIKREMEVMQPEMPREPAEKPDANMCLKYTFGVNAWKQWVATKNADFEKSSIRRKPIKSEILQLTADELNYSLCMFVKEVRKPNGSEYAPDTIYYLVLGIQQYLYENGRIDNIFTDRYYEQFTDCLDEVAKKFSVLYNDSQYIVTRVEEEHLWECKQLGAHSPHVLLSTLMFFNTKHFNLVTVDEHMELSFSHIMKHWKRNPNQPGAAKVPGSRNVLLRFYPPQSSLEANSRKKKVYEQQENEENPLRCPVKLYEFYLSKCPESVKTRNDVFYLQPERSCVPDSPVWYSTQPLSRDALSKMLHRVKMVKEINIALLTS